METKEPGVLFAACCPYLSSSGNGGCICYSFKSTDTYINTNTIESRKSLKSAQIRRRYLPQMISKMDISKMHKIKLN